MVPVGRKAKQRTLVIILSFGLEKNFGSWKRDGSSSREQSFLFVKKTEDEVTEICKIQCWGEESYRKIKFITAEKETSEICRYAPISLF